MMDMVKDATRKSSLVELILFQSFCFVAYSYSQDRGFLQSTRALIPGLRSHKCYYTILNRRGLLDISRNDKIVIRIRKLSKTLIRLLYSNHPVRSCLIELRMSENDTAFFGLAVEFIQPAKKGQKIGCGL